MNDRLSRIRENEKKSHTEIYTNEKLYATDSWLARPIKTMKEILKDGYYKNRFLL